MAVSAEDDAKFVMGIRRAEMWRDEGHDWHGDKHRPYVEEAIKLFENCRELMPSKPVPMLHDRTRFAMLKILAYRVGAACLQRILEDLDKSCSEPPPPTWANP
jgi:hypothetical protein